MELSKGLCWLCEIFTIFVWTENRSGKTSTVHCFWTYSVEQQEFTHSSVEQFVKLQNLILNLLQF